MNRRDLIKSGVAGLVFGTVINQVGQARPALDCLSTGNPGLDGAIGGGIYPGLSIIIGPYSQERFEFIRNLVNLHLPDELVSHIYNPGSNYGDDFGEWYLNTIFAKHQYNILEMNVNPGSDRLLRKASVVLSTKDSDMIKVVSTRYGNGLGHSFPLEVI